MGAKATGSPLGSVRGSRPGVEGARPPPPQSPPCWGGHMQMLQGTAQPRSRPKASIDRGSQECALPDVQPCHAFGNLSPRPTPDCKQGPSQVPDPQLTHKTKMCPWHFLGHLLRSGNERCLIFSSSALTEQGRLELGETRSLLMALCGSTEVACTPLSL